MDYATALKRMAEAGAGAPSREIALLSNWQSTILETFLVAHGMDRGCRMAVRSNPFGSLQLSLERLSSSASGPKDAQVIILIDEEIIAPGFSLRSDALPTRGSIEQALKELPARIQRFTDLLEQVARQQPVFLVPSILPPFPLLSAPRLAESRLHEVRHRLNTELSSLQSRNPLQIRVLDPLQVWGSLPPSGLRDDRLLFTGGWPLGLKATDLLAQALVDVMMQTMEARKILITDADQTLWQGIVGDDGADAISWAQEAETYRFFVYQKTLNLLMSEGILVAIASKNTPESLEAALARKDLVLDRGRLVSRRASWSPKSRMVADILAETNLLPSSAVFVDNSPFEIGEVQTAFPDIRGLLFPDANAGLRAFLEELRGCFDTRFVSEEDRQRSETIRLAVDFNRQRESSASLENYLRSLEMRATLEQVSSPTSDRAFQLVNKTNQFNLSGRRFDALEWKALLENENARVWQLTFRDKQGQYGMVSVLIVDAAGNITDWVLSCRVFGRTIEHFMVNFLLEQFRGTSVSSLNFQFKETTKNHAIGAFLKEVAVPDPGTGKWIRNSGDLLKTFVAPV
jgi:FkbH-like protein